MKLCTILVNDDIVYKVKYSELKLSIWEEVWCKELCTCVMQLYVKRLIRIGYY